MKDMIQLGDKDLFVAFRMPKATDYCLLQNEDKASDVYNFVIHPFDKNGSTPALTIQTDGLKINQPFQFHARQTCNVPETQKAAYIDLADRVIDQMKTTDLEKVVLSRVCHVQNDDINLFELFKNLMAAYPSAFIYIYNIPGQGAWMGATPEILMERNQDQITTVALAATQKVAGQEKDEVVWSPKEIEEQAIIQRYIETNLNRAGYPFKKGKSYTAQAGNVFHIKTVYDIPNISSTDNLVDLLHPGPAICGMPKMEAKRVILDGEDHQRKYYCGYIGLKTKEQTSLFINLRCMQVFQDQFALHVGGGLTKDSRAAAEWEETVLKSKTLKSVIQKSNIYAHDL